MSDRFYEREFKSGVRVRATLMSGECRLSESGCRQARGKFTALLNCIVFFGIGLCSQGVVLGVEGTPVPLVLSAGLGLSEEPGGSQGGVASSPLPLGEPGTGIALAKSALSASSVASVLATSPENSGNGDIQSVIQSAANSDVKVGNVTPVTDSVPVLAVPKSLSSSVSSVAVAGQLAQASTATLTDIVTVMNSEAQKNGEVKYNELAQKAKVAEVGSLKGFRWGLAPIRWGGDVSETFYKQSYSGGSTSMQNMQRANLNASTYIWQPWLARVRARIGVVKNKNVADSGNGESDASSSTSLVGSGSLALFPRSRFPFDALASVDKGRSGYSLSSNTTIVNRMLEFRQAYRPVSGFSDSSAKYSRVVSTTEHIGAQARGGSKSTLWALRHDYHPMNSTSVYGVGYDRNVWNAVGEASNASWGLQGNYSTSFDKQSFGVDARRTESYYALNGVDFTSSGIVMRHGYRPNKLLSVSSSASIDQSNMSADNSYNTRYLQANTNLSWQPDRDLPLYVTGSGRIYDSSYERLGTVNVSQNQIVSASARYAHTRNLSYHLDGSVANSKSGGVSNRTVTENQGVGYVADIIKFGNANYSRNANASLGFQTNTSSPSNRTVTGGAGHGLTMPYLLGGGASMDFSVNESMLARNDKINGQNRTLSHTGGMSWRPVPRGAISGSVNANLSDIRNVGGDERLHYQAASLGVNALNQTSANSSMRANAMLQWTSNGLGQYSNGVNATVDYKHSRAFNVQGLRYELMFNMSETQSRSADIQGGSSTTSAAALDQYLDYRIGRANLRLSLGLARYGKASSKSFMLHLGRNFGSL